MKILNPTLSDYNNRKEYTWLVQSLTALTSYFNIVQVRIALLAIFDVKDRGLITANKFKETIIYLENFHFAYNSIISLKANKLETIYSNFARELRKCINSEDINKVIHEKLVAQLEKIYPNENDFCEKFAELNYSKKNTPSNVKTKYAINKLNCYYSQKDVFEADGSIEHILPESSGEIALNIGNLILLEVNLNNEAGQNEYINKIDVYKKSQYKWILLFCSRNPDWNEVMIKERAAMMAETYYHSILGRK